VEQYDSEGKSTINQELNVKCGRFLLFRLNLLYVTDSDYNIRFVQLKVLICVENCSNNVNFSY